MTWGYHLVVDASRCLPLTIRNKRHIENFATSLVKKIDMVAFGDPQVQYFGSGNKGGFTLVQLIETSNITAHFCDETNDIYLDVFSCKPFDPSDVEGNMKLYFQPVKMNTMFFSRQAGCQPKILRQIDELR
jgi:S-adenosylmethionine/arginine decarboxylase-like enzyme